MHWIRKAGLLAIAFLAVAWPGDESQRHKWWESGDVRSELRITDAQSTSIEQIYEEAQPTLHSLMQRLNSEDEVCPPLSMPRTPRRRTCLAKSTGVKSARGALSKERLLMIYRMHRELTGDQRTALRDWLRTNRPAQMSRDR